MHDYPTRTPFPVVSCVGNVERRPSRGNVPSIAIVNYKLFDLQKAFQYFDVIFRVFDHWQMTAIINRHHFPSRNYLFQFPH